MKKRTIIINGIRASKFKVKCFKWLFILNNLVIIHPSAWIHYQPRESPRITIKSRHMKFKYPINKTVIKQLLTNNSGRIYKIYILKNNMAKYESELTREM